MLVLSRFRDETILIGDSIEVTVIDIRGDKVRLGIVADGMEIHRKEIPVALRRMRFPKQQGSVGDGASAAL